jgi:hypothetical protein
MDRFGVVFRASPVNVSKYFFYYGYMYWFHYVLDNIRLSKYAAGTPACATRFTAQLLCLLEISILLSFLHSKLSNKVIFPQPGLLYSLVIFENDVLFRKTDSVICRLKSCWRIKVVIHLQIWLQSSVVLLITIHLCLVNLDDLLRLPRLPLQSGVLYQHRKLPRIIPISPATFLFCDFSCSILRVFLVLASVRCDDRCWDIDE